MQGFELTGDSGNLILGDEGHVLIRHSRGPLVVTTQGSRLYTGYRDQGNAYYGYCSVEYETMVTDQEPPSVFATPTSLSKGGLGIFSHVGTEGMWTGFHVVWIPSITYGGGRVPLVGEHIGWDYHVCRFGKEDSGEDYGMRLYNSEEEITFDSSWDLIPFGSLLTQWVRTGGAKFSYGYTHYWGNWDANINKGVNPAAEFYRHPWGHADGTIGVKISSLSTLRCRADVGTKSNRSFTTAPMVGFTGEDRAYLVASVHFGILQHASTVYQSMNSFSIMTADLTGTG